MNFAFDKFSRAGRANENQDAVLAVVINHIGIAAVADGVGGRPAGSVASRLAVDLALSELSVDPTYPLGSLFASIQKKFGELAVNDPVNREMATTLTLLRVTDLRAEVGHVGDTRLYHLRGAGLVSRTIDQTEVQRLIDEGILDNRTARRYSRRNVLLSMLSANNHYEFLHKSFAVQPGDRLVLLSDGAYHHISKNSLVSISQRNASVPQFCKAIEDALNAAPVEDDFSCVVFEILGD